MFGHQDDQSHHDTNQADEPATEVITAGAPAQPADSAGQPWQHPGTPLEHTDSHDDQPIAHISPVTAADDDDDTDDDATTLSAPSLAASDQPTDGLLTIKQQALGQLSPLVGHLDQSPEEQFRTLMMMIQASDDQSLIKSAYNTAQKIDDEKARAQALLDIINEINYFTQPKHDKDDK